MLLLRSRIEELEVYISTLSRRIKAHYTEGTREKVSNGRRSIVQARYPKERFLVYWRGIWGRLQDRIYVCESVGILYVYLCFSAARFSSLKLALHFHPQEGAQTNALEIINYRRRFASTISPDNISSYGVPVQPAAGNPTMPLPLYGLAIHQLAGR